MQNEGLKFVEGDEARKEEGFSRDKAFQDGEINFENISSIARSRQEMEKHSKFEELEAASRNLERHLHERSDAYQVGGITVDDSQRIREIERHFQEKPSKFEELQKASHELERRLQERTITAVEKSWRIKYEAEMEKARNMLQNNLRKEKNPNERLEKLPKATQTNLPPPLSSICQSSVPKPISVRQDSNVSSDSFSQTSSPSYTSKTMEAPLLPHKQTNGKVPGSEVDKFFYYFIIIFIVPFEIFCFFYSFVLSLVLNSDY